MNRLTCRRWLVALILPLLVAGSLFQTMAIGAEGGKLPPEKTYSNAPFLHRIYIRDDSGNPLNAPKADPKAAAEERLKPLSTAETCGKCHAYAEMSGGWHFNAYDKAIPAGRPGEPWLLTDVQTRTQLPLSYRKWPGTYHPYELGINDYNFLKMFGRHLPGGGAFEHSKDHRFKMSGKFEIDCLICHNTTQAYDHVERAKQIAEAENFKYVPTVAALLGKPQGRDAGKLKDTWDPTDPDAPALPKVNYRADRFDTENFVTFQVSRRVANERCYFCHTTLDAGQREHGNKALEARFRHDRDIHMAKGMLCVDCHRNGTNHMITRGYEGENRDRLPEHQDPTIVTLSCRGCHYGEAEQHELGGRSAAPRPVHKGLPTLHFDKITCTTCHSGPLPGEETTYLQTSLNHRLGLPRHHHGDDMAPQIQQPVFLYDRDGRIAPHKLVYPAFWARLNGNQITPIQPTDVLAAGTGSVFGTKPGPLEDPPFQTLTKEQILQVLEKLATAKAPTKVQPAAQVMGAEPPAHKPAKPTATAPASVPASAPTTAATAPAATQPAVPPQFTGEPIYITGGKAYKRGGKDNKELVAFDHDAAKPYSWAIGHNVRSAQQALGAIKGCVDCHAFGAPVFESKVESDALLASATTTAKMHQMRGEGLGALAAFAATYPMRPILVGTGYICAVLLALLLLTYATRAIGAITGASRK